MNALCIFLLKSLWFIGIPSSSRNSCTLKTPQGRWQPCGWSVVRLRQPGESVLPDMTDQCYKWRFKILNGPTNFNWGRAGKARGLDPPCQNYQQCKITLHPLFWRPLSWAEDNNLLSTMLSLQGCVHLALHPSNLMPISRSKHRHHLVMGWAWVWKKCLHVLSHGWSWM